MENRTITLLIIIFVFAFLISCQRNESFFVNKELVLQIEKFKIESKYYCPYCDELIVMDVNKNDSGYVFFLKSKPPKTFDKLYTIVKFQSNFIFIYSDSDISEFVYSPSPYNFETDDFKFYLSNKEYDNIYRDMFYYNGKYFYRIPPPPIK